MYALSQTFNEPVFQFDWSGPKGTHGLNGKSGADNNILARRNAGHRLSEFVKNYEFKEDEPLNIVAHSHGGNVIKEYTKLYRDGDKKIDSIYFLATPHRSSHILNKDALSSDSIRVNAYDFSDLVQLAGAGLELGSRDLKGFIKAEIEVINKRYFFIFTPLIGDHTEIDSYSSWIQIQNIVENKK